MTAGADLPDAGSAAAGQPTAGTAADETAAAPTAVSSSPAPAGPAPGVAAAIAEVEVEATAGTAAGSAAGSGRAAAPGSTMAGVAMVKTLLAAHSVLRRDLDSIRETMRLISSGAPGISGAPGTDGDAEVAAKARKRVETLSMRQAAWQLKSFCDTYCQTVHAHHDIEDFRIFPAVAAIAPEAGPVVEYLTADHVELSRLLDDLSCAVGALPGAAAAWAGAEDAARELAEHLTAHLDLEEEHVLPPLVRLPDWI